MPKQRGLFPITGTMGGTTFYKTKDGGFLVRQAGGIDADRIATDPAFARTHENGQEFGRAGKAGRLLREALRGVIENVADSTVGRRIFSQFMKVLRADEVSNRGERNVPDGETELFRGFEFNAGRTLALRQISDVYAHNSAFLLFKNGAARHASPRWKTVPVCGCDMVNCLRVWGRFLHRDWYAAKFIVPLSI